MSDQTHTDAGGVEHAASADAAAHAQEEHAGSVVARDEHGEVAEHYVNPGLAPHVYRRADIDQTAARRREREVATLFGLSTLGTLIFIVSYFVFKPADKHDSNALLDTVRWSNLGLGLGLGLALFCIGAGAIHWAKTLMPDDEIVQERKPLRSSDEDRAGAVAALKEGAAGAGLGRRKLIRNSLLGAMAPLGLLALIPLRDLSTLPGDKLNNTAWRKGRRLVTDPAGHTIKPEDIPIGGVVHVQPEGVADEPDALIQEAKSAAIVIRLPPDELKESAPSRVGWDYNGIVCYSKICTHVGCPVGLYEQQTHHLLCPCHQSTFDVPRNCAVIFGPAARPLPQLKLTVDSEGYLVAAQDFQEPVGPSFWYRGR